MTTESNKPIFTFGAELQTLFVFENRILIEANGLLGKFLYHTGTREIFFSSISAININDGFLNASICFDVYGDTSGENTLFFSKKDISEVQKIRDFILEKKDAEGRSKENSQNISVTDELLKLRDLHKSGAIDDQEFMELKINIMKKGA